MTLNRLSQEKSPYLLQHQSNPVDWYAWNEEAFRAAVQQKKPIFLSIGYSTCYWCHVMEKESFENDQVADVLNSHFIAIKVDREERPDVDHLYMEAVTTLTGQGGWPMSVFLTPDLKPFWGGTYFPRDQFIALLKKIHDLWRGEPDTVSASAQSLTDHLSEQRSYESDATPSRELITRAAEQFTQGFDPVYGGFGSAPKFPPSMQVSFLLREYSSSGNKRGLHTALHTLRGMAYGGIHDHVGGGFHRYSVDGEWKIPHFEKMLYDNALLATTYLEAYQLTGGEIWRDVAKGTLDFCARELRSPDGGFYSALDAGEVGQEGEYYVWSPSTLHAVFQDKEEAEWFSGIYGVTESGNFEHGASVLSLPITEEWTQVQHHELQRLRGLLLNERALHRTRPHLDDKILTSWNALAIVAFAKGFQVLREEHYLAVAREAMSFALDNLYGGDKLFRRYRKGEAGIDAYAEDYAFLIEALLTLYESDGAYRWLEWAEKLQSRLDELFWDAERGGYIYSDAEELLIRERTFIDNAIPSPNSVAALSLLRLYHLFGNPQYKQRAQLILKACGSLVERYPSAFPKMLHALWFYHNSPAEVVISGSTEVRAPIVAKFHQSFLPSTVLCVVSDEESVPPIGAGKGEDNGSLAVYVCREGSCSLPVSSFEALEPLLRPIH